MSLKSIDMQLAVTRAMDVGNVKQQMSQKPVDDQAAQAMQSAKQQELERTKSTQTEKPSDGKIRDNKDKSGQGEREGGSRQDGGDAQEQAKPRDAKHPFKGKFIDLSL